MTTKKPLRLWWKAYRDPAQLHPEIKMVYDERVGHPFPRRYWVRVPEIESSERRHEFADTILHGSGATTQYEGYGKGYQDFKGKLSMPPIGAGVSFGRWEELVNQAHKQLRDVLGGDRVAVFIPLEQVPEVQIAAQSGGVTKNTEDLPLLTLMVGTNAELVSRILKDMGLSYFYYPTFRGLVASTETLAWSHLLGELRRGLATLSDLLNLPLQPIPAQVIDPQSKKPINFDDYLKRHLPELEDAYFKGLQEAVRNFDSELRERVNNARAQSLQDIHDRGFGSPDKEKLASKRDHWIKFTDWLKEHSSVFKAWLSFFVPAGERNAATLACYAYAKTAADYVTMVSGKPPMPSATTLLSWIQERFEHWVEEGKKALGMEKATVPAETLLKILDKVMMRSFIMEVGWTEINYPHIGVRMLATPPLWTHLKESEIKDKFKQVAEALANEPLKDGFEDFLHRREFYDAISSLGSFHWVVSWIAAKALGGQQVKPISYDDGFLREVAKRAVNKFHNELSQVVKAIVKAKATLLGAKEKELEVAKNYAVAVVGFSPTDFYTLTTDGTCFSAGNISHPFYLGMMPGSFVLRVFAGGRSIARAWGIIKPGERVLYVTNRYGDINQTALIKVGTQVASALFGVPPEDLEVKENAVVEFAGLMYDTARKVKIPTTPYLNRDAFKISAKRG